MSRSYPIPSNRVHSTRLVYRKDGVNYGIIMPGVQPFELSWPTIEATLILKAHLNRSEVYRSFVRKELAW